MNYIKTHLDDDDTSNILCNEKYDEITFEVIYYSFPYLIRKQILY